MAISKIIYKSSSSAAGEVWMDTTQKTVTPGTMLNGTTALKNDGTDITGTIASKSSSDLTASGATVTAPAGYYASAATKTVASGTEGTPTATKGSVSNHSVTVTPSVTNAAGYISGGTKTGTAVSVSVSELESGTKTITENGTGISVSGYSAVDVNVSGGGGGHFADNPKLVFIDYDGTVLSSYTSAEAQALTALPANPSHSGLVAQGWNWTLQQIKAQLTAYPDQAVYVGQMYITQSGDTEIDVRFADAARLSPIMSIAVNGTVTIDWGDNTTADTVTGTSLTTRQNPTHIYAAPGDYTIVIHVVSGSFQFYASSTYTILRKNTTGNQNRVYANTLRAVRLGSGITSLYNYTFNYCTSLASITIPSSVTSVEINAFANCFSLASITIPSSVTSIGNSAFSYCYSLASITMPNGVTSIGSSAFTNCTSLALITIPSSVTSIGSSAFSNCTSLALITIPSSVTSIDNSTFTYCYSFASITIPNGVTSIGNSAFSNCYGVAEYHILPTTVPTGGTTMFSSIVSDCVIYVPKGKLSNYQGATNWSTYASYMQEEP